MARAIMAGAKRKRVSKTTYSAPALEKGFDIIELLATAPEERCAMGARGRAFVLAEHCYPVLAQRFLNACSPRSAP